MNTNRHRSDEEIRAERSAKRFYVGLVLMLFAIQCTILGTAIKFITGRTSLAVVPNYHKAALDWDSTHAANGAAIRKGWVVDIDVSDVVDGAGNRAVELTVVDSEGIAIDDLEINGRVYHHANAYQVDTLSLQAAGEGRYIGLPSMALAGVWQLELTVENAGEPMNLTKVVDLKI